MTEPAFELNVDSRVIGSLEFRCTGCKLSPNPCKLPLVNVTAALVKELREKTGAGMMDCKNALTEVEGEIEAANDWLRKKGLSKAAK